MVVGLQHANPSQRIDDALRSKVSVNVYGLWFQSLSYSLMDSTLTVDCPGLIHKEHVSQRYQGDLAAVALDVLGFAPKLEFRVSQAAPSPQGSQEVQREPLKKKRSMLLKSCDVYPSHSFDRFVVGPDNQIAYASCLAIAQESSKQYNPLFLHGSTGLGKTHLLQAIYNHMCRESSHLNILYTNCEAFTNEFISSIRNHSLDVFRDLYRGLDVLIVDDIQFLGDKTSTQEEFFHTFNDLILSDKRVILSSDSAPHELQRFESRLISRFSSGLVTSIQAPGYETRLTLIRHKAQTLGIGLVSDIEMALASLDFSNVRELHGALVTLEAHVKFSGHPITEETIHKLFPTLGASGMSFEKIVNLVCKEFDVSLSDLQSKRRPHSIAFPRQVGMYLLREHTGRSLHEIGVFFGGRDHSTVQYAHSKIVSDRGRDAKLSSRLKNIEEIIRKGC